ncbi:protein of unknown function [Clostridium beijerinckii]|nr:protein of unknown function [Clostridium beijerinckii]
MSLENYNSVKSVYNFLNSLINLVYYFKGIKNKLYSLKR